MNSQLGRRVQHATCAAVICAATLTVPVSGAAQAQEDLVFHGSAEAFGSRMTLLIPDAPVSDRVIDLSAPTSTARLSSIGDTNGFAAFPSPGETVLSLPGMIAAVAQQEVGGLPSIELPPLPDYPLSVSADSLNPEVTVGEGPYRLHAYAQPNRAGGSGQGGLQFDAAGSAAMVNADADITNENGTVTATATSAVEGLTVGPLSLGIVRSVATVTLDSGGIPETSASLEIEGARLAGVAVDITADGIELAGVPVEFPIGETLEDILDAGGITFDWSEPVADETTVTHPGITISMPVEVPDVGTGTGTASITVGAVSASLEPAAPFAPPPVEPPPPAGPTTPVDTGGPISAPPGADASATPVDVAETETAAAPSTNNTGTVAVNDIIPTGLTEAVDLKAIYLLTVLGALLTVALASAIRHIGVRNP